jgi:hypothetical protein
MLAEIMDQNENLLRTVFWIVLVYLAFIGVCSILEKLNASQMALAWENRPRIGFQPHPESPEK